ncbi:variant erythrocyte surface antigen beta subunit, putative [Babesia ovis]|uniref:Variant erythrocyte surface antigen beta subunit, putative n=1 Tax=Babesia ovis TaxID=5869 RepID=A0A9W5WWH2_BABOV|nr:variant erythrocyte surface antigen beta subunit, putative [Babesia ovis]
MAAASQQTGLLKSPTNLKEAIDWILRVTNKDGQGNGASGSSTHMFCELAAALRDLLSDVDQELLANERNLVSEVVDTIRDVGGTYFLKEMIIMFGQGLQGMVMGKGSSTTGVTDIAEHGICSKGGSSSGYASKSSYNASSATWENVRNSDANVITCAKTMMGCIPLVFGAITYIYWKSSYKGGNGFRCHDYLKALGYKDSELNSDITKQSSKVKELLEKCFNGLDKVKDKVSNATYAKFLMDLEANTSTTSGVSTALMKFYILATGYFRSLQTKRERYVSEPVTPRTIREALYFISCLPYTLVYRRLIQNVQRLCQRHISRSGQKDKGIVFTSSNSNSGNPDENTFTVDGNKASQYLLSACLYAPCILLNIQGTLEAKVSNGSPSASTSGEPVLHRLYANSVFSFTFPRSDTHMYSLLCIVLYGLYYQLYFLQLQCGVDPKSSYGGCSGAMGWQWCNYGKEIKCDNCTSWMCSIGDKGAHKNGSSGNQCGTNGTPSPLQAFLTDCLPGFTCKTVKSNMETYKNSISREYPSLSEHFKHQASEYQYCPMPMGFTGSFHDRWIKTGNDIYAVLSYYSSYEFKKSSLYQLVRCVFALRTVIPRTLGALVGFFVGAISSSRSDPGALKETLQGLPGAGNQKDLVDALRKLGGTSEKRKQDCMDGRTDIGVLCRVGDGVDKGITYLNPLTGHLYDTVSPVFGMTYVSWIVYLLKHLKQGLEKLMDDFRRIDCQQSGCERGQNGRGVMACADGSCQPGTHGYECKCKSIVDCVGVHSVLYKYGFTYSGGVPSPMSFHWWKSKAKDIMCQEFYKKIRGILTGKPSDTTTHVNCKINGASGKPSGQLPGENLLDNLLTAVRQYKYRCRMPFGLYVTAFWLAVLGYLVYSMTVNLDLMHIQSHWRSPSSYLVPLQRILADGSRNVKRVCTMKYFSDGTGNGLLEQGINDLYL